MEDTKIRTIKEPRERGIRWESWKSRGEKFVEKKKIQMKIRKQWKSVIIVEVIKIDL